MTARKVPTLFQGVYTSIPYRMIIPSGALLRRAFLMVEGKLEGDIEKMMQKVFTDRVEVKPSASSINSLLLSEAIRGTKFDTPEAAAIAERYVHTSGVSEIEQEYWSMFHAITTDTPTQMTHTDFHAATYLNRHHTSEALNQIWDQINPQYGQGTLLLSNPSFQLEWHTQTGTSSIWRNGLDITPAIIDSPILDLEILTTFVGTETPDRLTEIIEMAGCPSRDFLMQIVNHYEKTAFAHKLPEIVEWHLPSLTDPTEFLSGLHYALTATGEPSLFAPTAFRHALNRSELTPKELLTAVEPTMGDISNEYAPDILAEIVQSGDTLPNFVQLAATAVR